MCQLSTNNDPFYEQFSFYVEMFLYRAKRMLSIDTTVAINQQEYLMVFDATMVIFRSLFLENEKKNYTYRHFLTAIGKKEIISQIDTFLNSPFENENSKSIRDVLKFIIDKFICHLDKISYTEIGLCNAYMAKLKNPEFDRNFLNIIKELYDIIHSSL